MVFAGRHKIAYQYELLSMLTISCYVKMASFLIITKGWEFENFID